MQTEHLSNTSLQHYCYINLLSHWRLWNKIYTYTPRLWNYSSPFDSRHITVLGLSLYILLHVFTFPHLLQGNILRMQGIPGPIIWFRVHVKLWIPSGVMESASEVSLLPQCRVVKAEQTITAALQQPTSHHSCNSFSGCQLSRLQEDGEWSKKCSTLCNEPPVIMIPIILVCWYFFC